MENLGVTIMAAGVILGLGLSWLMGRRGFEPSRWTMVGVIFGPIAVIAAIATVDDPATATVPTSSTRHSRGSAIVTATS